MVITAAVSSTIAVLVALFADKGNDPAGRLARCFVGFFVAVVWIMAIADEVVTVLQVRRAYFLAIVFSTIHDLQTFGFIFGFSDAIIGL
jgi:sodium/potassium/calcium exchanger 6